MYRGLTKIKTQEEYDKRKEDLQYCLDEYAWFSQSEDPKKEISDSVKGLLNELNPELSQEEQLRILKEIHLLQVKYVAIRNGDYEPTLKRNIQANLILTQQYEAAQEKRSPWSIISGVLTGNKVIRNHVQNLSLVSDANSHRAAQDAIDLRRERLEYILEYMSKNYHFVNITIPTEEKGLVPVQDIGFEDSVQARIREMTESFLTQKFGDDVIQQVKQQSQESKQQDNAPSTHNKEHNNDSLAQSKRKAEKEVEK